MTTKTFVAIMIGMCLMFAGLILVMGSAGIEYIYSGFIIFMIGALIPVIAVYIVYKKI